MEGKEVGYGIFVARAFQDGQITEMYIGVTCGDDEVSDYAITNKYDIQVMKLNVKACYLEYT